MRIYYLPVFFGILLLLITLQPVNIQAQANTNTEANFGIGIMFGEPTGVSIKNWFSERTAIDVGAAWSLSDRNEAIHLHSNLLLHNWFKENLAFYYGVGARVIFADDPEAGVRIPFGLNYVFPNASFDLFVEAAPILNLTPSTGFAGNGAFGLRFYF